MSPAEAVGTDAGLSVFLFHLQGSPDLRSPAGKGGRSGATLDLHFLITAHLDKGIPDVSDREAAALAELGRAIGVLHDNQVLRGARLRGELADTDLVLRVEMVTLTTKDLAAVWSLFPGISYRTSAAFRVSLVPIEG